VKIFGVLNLVVCRFGCHRRRIENLKIAQILNSQGGLAVALPQNIRFDNLLSSVKGYLTPDVVRSASSMTGESETATRQAMHGGVSSIFAGLANLASTPEGASTLGNLSREPAYGSLLNNIPAAFAGGGATTSLMNAGQGLLGKIFGDRSSGVNEAVAQSSGVSTSSAGKIMSLLAPVTMGVLGKQVLARGLSNTGLANMLLDQKDEIAAAAPAGISRLFRTRAPEPVAVRVAPDTDVYTTSPRATTVREPERPAGARWLPLLLVIVAVLGLLWFLRNISGRAKEAGRQAVESTQAALAKITLPGGVDLSVPTGSINYNLAKFLADGNQTAPRTFVFDHLNFETASTQLTPDSTGTVNNLAQILKAYPNVQVQLSGHTDNTGAPDTNQKLSLDRANAVKQMLVSGGIAGERITTNGYGQDRPIASNDTEEGKAKNRRLELTVTQK
jgi:outer membrane protein OmpA-like peptidoglycan-associated protein